MIYVIGGANIDLNIKINGVSRLKESNPSAIYKTYGGVSRNIAKAISLYNKCSFIGVLPNESIYKDLVNDLVDSGIDTKYIKYIYNKSSMYINVIDDNGLVIGASEMSSIDELDIDFIKSLNLETKDEDIIVMDANLRLDTVEYILSNFKGLKFFDAVSSKKLEKFINLTDKFDLIKTNKYEYEIIKDKASNFLLTNSNSVTLKYNNEVLKVKHNTLDTINPSGCGDSMFGVLISLFNKNIKEALEYGIYAGAATSQIESNTPSINDINNIKDKINITWIE